MRITVSLTLDPTLNEARRSKQSKPDPIRHLLHPPPPPPPRPLPPLPPHLHPHPPSFPTLLPTHPAASPPLKAPEDQKRNFLVWASPTATEVCGSVCARVCRPARVCACVRMCFSRYTVYIAQDDSGLRSLKGDACGYRGRKSMHGDR